MEKRLRSLLARSPEWNDAAERQRLAAVLEAEEVACGCAPAAAASASAQGAPPRRLWRCRPLASALRWL